MSAQVTRHEQLVEEISKLLVSPVTECVEWRHSLSRGYGQLRVPNNRGMTKPHKVSYALAYGELAEGLVIRHLCNNSKCHNPAHLTSGTASDNQQDYVKSGYYQNGRQTLSDKDLQNMREEYTGKYGEVSKLARKYKISNSQAHRLLKQGYRNASKTTS